MCELKEEWLKGGEEKWIACNDGIKSIKLRVQVRAMVCVCVYVVLASNLSAVNFTALTLLHINLLMWQRCALRKCFNSYLRWDDIMFYYKIALYLKIHNKIDEVNSINDPRPTLPPPPPHHQSMNAEKVSIFIWANAIYLQQIANDIEWCNQLAR